MAGARARTHTHARTRARERWESPSRWPACGFACTYTCMHACLFLGCALMFSSCPRRKAAPLAESEPIASSDLGIHGKIWQVHGKIWPIKCYPLTVQHGCTSSITCALEEVFLRDGGGPGWLCKNMCMREVNDAGMILEMLSPGFMAAAFASIRESNLKRVRLVGGVWGNRQGFPTPTNQRHCVNSKSLKFEGA